MRQKLIVVLRHHQLSKSWWLPQDQCPHRTLEVEPLLGSVSHSSAPVLTIHCVNNLRVGTVYALMPPDQPRVYKDLSRCLMAHTWMSAPVASREVRKNIRRPVDSPSGPSLYDSTALPKEYVVGRKTVSQTWMSTGSSLAPPNSTAYTNVP